MTIEELRERLSQFPPQCIVEVQEVVMMDGGAQLHDSHGIRGVMTYDNERAKIVIEVDPGSTFEKVEDEK